MNQKKIHQLIKKNKRFLICAHVNPDPDAICSQMAMALYLKKCGKTPIVVTEVPLNERFKFLPAMKMVKALKDIKTLKYDVCIVLDSGNFDRIGKVDRIVDQSKPIINIDHHITNDKFGSINCVVPQASSTGEVLFELFESGPKRIDKNIAIHIYCGIMTDTGSFRFENTTPKTLSITSQLRKFDFSTSDLYERFYDNIPLKDLKQLTTVLTKFEIICKGQVVTLALPKSTISKFSTNFDLRDTIFKFLRAIKGVEAILIFTEVSKKTTRVNMRSARKVNVASIANNFGGGGHKRASGCMLDASIKDAKKEILKLVRKAL